MEMYKKNMDALKQKYPIFHNYYLNYEEKDNSEEVCPVIQDVCGKDILAVEKDGKLYQLDSLYDSSLLCDAWYKWLSQKINLNCKHIMFGFGNGMFIRHFINNAPKDNKIIVCEPSARLFHTVIKSFDISDILLNDRLILIVPNINKKEGIQRELLKHLVYSDMGTSHAFVHMNYDVIFGDECNEFLKDADRTFSTLRVNNDLLAKRGQIIYENIKNNMHYLVSSKQIGDLKGICNGITGIIVSAGPSLNKNVKELQNAKGKSIIVAVDSAIRTLEAAGVEPDLIVNVDPRKGENFLNSKKCEGIPLLTCLHANSGFIRNHKGIQFFADSYEPYITDFTKNRKIRLLSVETGGSVATSAFSLLRYMGCKSIILVGQDLAYTGDKTHAAESVDAVRTVEELEGNLIDIDVYGNPVKTSADMRRYKEWFEQIIAENPSLKVMDATEGGAFIKGTEVITLLEAVRRECVDCCDVNSKIAKVSDLFNDEQKKEFIDYLKKMPEFLNDARETLGKIIRNYKKMTDLVGTNRYRSKEFILLSRKTNEMLSNVEKNPFMEFAMKTCYEETNEINQTINHAKADEREELNSIIEISAKYANILKNAIERTMNDAIEMVNNLGI